MPTFQSYFQFTAQTRTLSAFMRLHSRSESFNSDLSDRLPIVVFMAFTIESYINSIGYRLVPDWMTKERKRWSWKIDRLHSTVGKKADWKSVELISVSELFDIRDRIAHGKPEYVHGPDFATFNEAKEYLQNFEPEPPWLKAVDENWIVNSREKLERILRYLAEAANLHSSDYLHSATGRVLANEDSDA